MQLIECHYCTYIHLQKRKDNRLEGYIGLILSKVTYSKNILQWSKQTVGAKTILN